MKLCLVLVALLVTASCKVFSRCGLVKELKKLGARKHELDTWVCIAKYESRYDTSAVNKYTGDHGIFQISELFWCNRDDSSKACHIPCAKLENDNIADDFKCAKKIYKEHKRLQGDGFKAWVAYKKHCSHGRAKGFAHCS